MMMKMENKVGQIKSSVENLTNWMDVIEYVIHEAMKTKEKYWMIQLR